MGKTRLATTALLITILFVSAIGGTVFYFNRVINDRDSQIASLKTQIAKQNNEIANLTSQNSNLENQVENLTGQIKNLPTANLTTSLGVTEEPVHPLNTMPSLVSYNHLYISGTVKNLGEVTAFNAGLHVVAYDANGTLEINMTVPLVDNLATFGTDATITSYFDGNPNSLYYHHGSLQLGNLESGQIATIDLGIFHEGTAYNWTVTPVWTN